MTASPANRYAIGCILDSAKRQQREMGQPRTQFDQALSGWLTEIIREAEHLLDTEQFPVRRSPRRASPRKR